MSDNQFSASEAVAVLCKLGAGRVQQRSNSIRGCCPIHHGDNAQGFAGWTDSAGGFRFTCHTHKCVNAASLEWVVRRVQQGTIHEAVRWLAEFLGRTDLVVTDFNHGKELSIQEDATPAVLFSGDVEELARLKEIHPYHTYWRDRGYSPELVREFELTYRSLDRRALVPMRDANLHLLGTMERATDGAVPKYKWNSPNPNKGSFLYGIPQALSRPITVLGNRVVFLVEGTLDPVKAAGEGFPVVASQTNRLSAAQAKCLIDHWDLVIVVPDTDGAGQSLVLDLVKRVNPFLNTAILGLPQCIKDLDELPTDAIRGILTPAINAWAGSFTNRNRFTRQETITIGA